ncbi:hypothetical protein ANCCAN_09951 [Ancylostoma caninum]|uniref:Saposin B-type domain-containing protein n=1 Tax=Ancylostoma caninum TaxID=29170 RepID=A0A368GK82_ANCCA|nr:hypothetical protein ANCCAN_09951 [Ancylostoma caninum]
MTMQVVCVIVMFCLSYLVNANRDCRLECFQAAQSYRNGKHDKVGNIEEYVMKDCESFAKDLRYQCANAVPLILNNTDIKKTIEVGQYCCFMNVANEHV